MSVQKNYGFATEVGNPGGIYDLADYISDSRNNAENDGVIKFGFGVMAKSGKEGKAVALPSVSNTVFEGVVMNTGTTEMDMKGNVVVPARATLGIMKRGRIWVRLGEEAVAGYGKEVYLITAGDEKGKFTTVDDTDSTKIAINGKFITSAQDDIAAIDFFGGSVITVEAPEGATKLTDLEDVDADSAADGDLLTYDGTGAKWTAKAAE